MNGLHQMGKALAGLLIGLGIAITAKTAADVGGDHFALGYVYGPGLVAAGIVRLRLQRMLGGRGEEGDDGNAS